MNLITRFSLLLVLGVAMFTSCKKPAPTVTRFIPKEAILVASVNTSSIKDKLIKSQITLENMFKNMTGKGDTSLQKGRKEWEEFQKSGIDLDENFYVSVVQKGGGSAGVSNMIISALGSLDDAAKLEAYLKKQSAGVAVVKEKEFSYAMVENDKLVAWGKDVVMMMYYQSTTGGMQYDSITGSFTPRSPADNSTELKAQAAASFALSEDQSVGSITAFKDLAQEKSDASIWANSSASLTDLPIPLPKLKELIKDSYSASTIDFEDGKITLSSKSYSGKALQDIFKKYAGPEANLDLIKNYPSANINSFGVFAFNPEIFDAVVRYLEVGGVVDGFLTQAMGSTYTLTDALKAIKGDVSFVVSDLSMPPAAMPGQPNTAIPGMGGMPAGKFLMNIPVGDKAQMNKMMDKLVQMQLMTRVNNEYVPTQSLSSMKVAAVVDDKNLIIASDDAVLKQYKGNTGKAVFKDGVLSYFDKKASSVYIDIESILNVIKINTTDPKAAAVLPKAKETFKDIRITGDNYNGKYTEAHGEITFKNTKENSLTSLISFLSTVSEAAKNWTTLDYSPDDMPADTTAIVPE